MLDLGPSCARRRGAIEETMLLCAALLRQRYLAARRDWAGRLVYVVAAAAGAVLFVCIALMSYAGAAFLRHAHAQALLVSIPAWAFLVYLFTDVFIAFGQALGDLYLAADVPVLLVMPLRIASIVVAKFVAGVVTNEVYVATFLVPFVLGYLAGAAAAWWSYPLALLGVVAFPALLYATLASVTIVVLRFVRADKAKEVLWLCGAVVPMIFWVISFWGIARANGDIATLQLPVAPIWLPSTWVGNLVAAGATHDLWRAVGWCAFLLATTVLGCPAALAFIARGFLRGYSEAVTSPPPAPRRFGRFGQSSALRALIRKDVRTFLRTPQLWFGHITALGFIAYLLVGHRAQTPLLPLTVQLAMIQLGFVAMLAGLNPGMTALSLEHAAVWLLRSLPLSAADIVGDKLVVAWSQTAVLICAGGLALCYGYHFEVPHTFAVLSFGLLMAAVSVGCGLAFDATYPSFQWDNPNAINRGIRMVIPFLVSLAVLLACALVLGIARVALHGAAGVAAGLVASALLAAAVVRANIHRALQRVAHLEP
jgi:hypothetical protein